MAYPNGSLLDHNSRSELSEDNLPINRVQKSWRIFDNPLLSSPHGERHSSGGVSPPYPTKNTYE